QRVASGDQPSCSQRSRIRLRKPSAASVGASLAGRRASMVWTIASAARAHAVGPFGGVGGGGSACRHAASAMTIQPARMASIMSDPDVARRRFLGHYRAVTRVIESLVVAALAACGSVEAKAPDAAVGIDA